MIIIIVINKFIFTGDDNANIGDDYDDIDINDNTINKNGNDNH